LHGWGGSNDGFIVFSRLMFILRCYSIFFCLNWSNITIVMTGALQCEKKKQTLRLGMYFKGLPCSVLCWLSCVQIVLSTDHICFDHFPLDILSLPQGFETISN